SMFLPGHVHVRCPGNIGLLACLVQLFFPWKRKSFKYAGNWIDNKGQPISYRIQKWIISNCWLTRKSMALVYGKKPSDNGCVTNAFTATYSEKDKLQISIRSLISSEPIKLVFAGALIPGKNPLVAVETCRILNENGFNAILTICGSGQLSNEVLKYTQEHGLHDKVICNGNLSRNDLDVVYQSNHFLLMPSKSEGWPKSVAEAMWWGILPVVSPVSCVPDMLDHGRRGILVAPDPSQNAKSILSIIENPEQYSCTTRTVKPNRQTSPSISWVRKHPVLQPALQVLLRQNSSVRVFANALFKYRK
ncbi:MAG: glycosyltransferase family 4 protein, partial [Bacteroidota bacterium]